MASRPNRSDIHVSKEEEARSEELTRDYFDGIAPKRHSKPQRSEPSSVKYQDDNTTDANSLPELAEFHRLQTNPEKLVYNGGSNNLSDEEFTETEYYKDLNCVDKHHHTTGTGFISIAEPSHGFTLGANSDISHHPSSKAGNPARNDWIPSPFEQVSSESGKPRRSEN